MDKSKALESTWETLLIEQLLWQFWVHFDIRSNAVSGFTYSLHCRSAVYPPTHLEMPWCKSSSSKSVSWRQHLNSPSRNISGFSDGGSEKLRRDSSSAWTFDGWAKAANTIRPKSVNVSRDPQLPPKDIVFIIFPIILMLFRGREDVLGAVSRGLPRGNRRF